MLRAVKYNLHIDDSRWRLPSCLQKQMRKPNIYPCSNPIFISSPHRDLRECEEEPQHFLHIPANVDRKNTGLAKTGDSSRTNKC